MRQFDMILFNAALLAVANRRLSYDFVITTEKSALFPRRDRFECLSPHNIAALLLMSPKSLQDLQDLDAADHRRSVH